MRHKIDYKIVKALTIEYLEMQVRKLLEEGWKCEGGLVFIDENWSEQFHQAMSINIIEN